MGRGIERVAQVGGLGVQALEPGRLIAAAKVRRRALGEVTVEVVVPQPYVGIFPRLPQALQAVCCDALQQPISRAVRPFRDHNEGAVHQPGQQA